MPQIVNNATGQCLDTWSLLGALRLAACHNAGGNQLFGITHDMQILAHDHCWQAAGADDADQTVRTVSCVPHHEGQQFAFDTDGWTLRSVRSSMCLTADDDAAVLADADAVTVPQMQPCDGSSRQQWVLSMI